MAEHARTGRWSKLRARFLEENQPADLEKMREDGTLDEYLNRIEDEYNEQFSKMSDERVKETQLEIRYGRKEIDWQTYVGEYNQIRNEIRELLTAKLCQ